MFCARALAGPAPSLRRGLPVTLAMLAIAASAAHAVEYGGPFGPELPSPPQPPAHAFSSECAPDIHGVTVRVIQTLAPSAPEGQQYRNLVSRLDANGAPVEEPFAFAANPFVSFPWGVACDGVGGFAVVWENYDEPCLRVRAFASTGAAATEEQLLWRGCTQRRERVLQLDHVGGQYRVLWQSRKPSLRRDQIAFRTLTEDTLGSSPVVVLKRLPISDNHPWYDRTARMDNDDTALVVWKKSFVVKGQLIGLDGDADTDVFPISLSHESPATLEPIEDAGDGTMIARWNSFWQAGLIGRRVAVSIPISEPPSTTTTTMPNDPDVPVFLPANRLQSRRHRTGPNGAYQPTLAADAKGNAIAVWTGRDKEFRPTIFYSRYREAAERWGKRHELPHDKSGMLSYRPRIVSLGNDEWIAMWIQAAPTGCSLVTTKSVDAGTTWSLPVFATQYAVTIPSACWMSDFELSADSEGALLAAWPDRSGPGEDSDPLLRVSRSLDRGATWSAPFTALSLEDDAWRGFSLAPGGDGKWGIVWTTNFYTSYYDHTDTGGQVFFSGSTDSGGNWSPPIVITGSPGASPGQPMLFGPMIASDRNGTWIVAWSSIESSAAPAGDGYIFSSRSSNMGRNWSAPARVADYAWNHHGNDSAPSIATDEQGRWMIAWETSVTVPGASGLDYDIVAASSDDAGESWTTPIAVDRGADSDQQINKEVDLVNGGPGRWFAAWTDRTEVPEKFGVGVRGAALLSAD